MALKGGAAEDPFLPWTGNAAGRACIEKFDIRPGKRIGCTLKVITRGTCTPILFEFPSLTSGDAAPR
jgi:hypothetical protein